MSASGATSSTSIFSISLVINYEDTDAGGVVYYGNYLGYMERARNAYLRTLGYPVSMLESDSNILFVVTDAKLQYLLPAKLDDELQVTLGISRMTAATIEFEHLVLGKQGLLVRGDIRLAVLDKESFKPRRIPDFLRQCFAQAA